MAGIRAFRQDRELMQDIHWLKYRLKTGDTFLIKENIAVLEAELGYDIEYSKDKIAMGMLRRTIENFNAQFGKQAGDQTPRRIKKIKFE